MAGYLGTLFMANVGMRLLLPPRGEYNKAATNFGQMVQKVQKTATRFYRGSSTESTRSLSKALGGAARISQKFGKQTSENTVRGLSRTLSKISTMTNSRIKSMSTLSSKQTQHAMTSPTGRQTSLWMGAQKFGTVFKDNLAQMAINAENAQLRMQRLGWSTVRLADNLAGPVANGFAIFRNALGISVTMITTMGYAISGLASGFAQFEKELINANSIWQESNEVLFEISDRVIKFGEDYGVAYDNASRVLYQFASAGLEAAEAQAVLNDVLILTMAVQGDANTIGKLTVQTIKGFGLEMSDAGVLTDKFAHAINASLIEYQDLASAIKFALPFFAATNQNVDQLLGSIQILTDRALEAGIAGRGLRQALAEFAEGAEDATRKFSKMGVKVVDAQGNFLKMTEIARNFSNAVGTEIANDTELLTALIEDLNIRGATAFIHLVQNVDEFEQAVSELAGSQGAANEMAMIQQNSLVMQIQLLKNAAKEVFFLSEEQYVANGYMNEFDMNLKNLIMNFKELFITELPDGTKELTEFSYQLRDLVNTVLIEFAELTEGLIKTLVKMNEQGKSLKSVIEMLFLPLKMVNTALVISDKILGPIGGSGLVMKYYMLSLVFTRMGAAMLMAANSMQYLVNVIASGSDTIKQVLGWVLMLTALIPGGQGISLGARGMGSMALRTGAQKGAKGVAQGGRMKEYLGGVNIRGRNIGGQAVREPYVEGVRGLGLGSQKGQLSQVGKWSPPAARTPSGELFKTRESIMATERLKLETAGGTGIRGNQYMNAQERLERATAIRLRQQAKTGVYTTGTFRTAGRRAREEWEAKFIRQLMMGQFMRAGLLGAVGAQSAFGANITGYNQNYAYDPMLAQMSTSSTLGTGVGGQDLYIDNATISTSNFQDLFYNSTQRG